jgi:hypothetical protein
VFSLAPTLAKSAGPPPPPQAAKRETLDIRDASNARLAFGVLGVIVIFRTDEIKLRRKAASLEPLLERVERRGCRRRREGASSCSADRSTVFRASVLSRAVSALAQHWWVCSLQDVWRLAPRHCGSSVGRARTKSPSKLDLPAVRVTKPCPNADFSTCVQTNLPIQVSAHSLHQCDP